MPMPGLTTVLLAPRQNSSDAQDVRISEELGRHLVATRDFQPGDAILTEEPLVFAPKATADPEAFMPCVGCYKKVFTDMEERCPDCGWPVCSGNCPGLKDPQHHGAECQILSLRPECVLDDMADYYRHDALLPLRCLLLQKTDPDKWSRLMEMQSHMECRTPGTESYDEADEFIVQYLMNNFLNLLTTSEAKLDMKFIQNLSPELIHKICGIVDTNALEIRLGDGIELHAIYAKTSFMEHSCIPNTKHTFNVSNQGKNEFLKITIKAVVPIMKNNHVTTMYSHALWGTLARRQHLKDTKYFSCKCERCSDPTELGTYLSAMKCLGDGNNPCDGIHLPEDPLDDETDWACNKCSVKVNNSQVSMIISQMGEEVENVQMMNPSVPILESLLPNLMSQEILDRKIKMCKDLIFVTKTLDPGNARLSLYTAVLQHELHSALVAKSKKTNVDGTFKSVTEVKELLSEAKIALDEALSSLKDDVDESAGSKLHSVIKNSEKDFKDLCKKKDIYF
ncbi:SET domain-containing protein SmydA-8, isoform A [Eumeta japonica]|uniref:SET domain-containing protein SmydA-8, isoform A n=1 Tax=Eumeta variegata TaxID=151549 RepID=A0A4C1WW36_EUMVA|nr:SET domain-containing protein SmydA-8, isoform A [Eumeta japonica]